MARDPMTSSLLPYAPERDVYRLLQVEPNASDQQIAVACRRHANLTPAAVMRDKRLTLDDYLASPKIADPFRKEDCCLISDGGGAFVGVAALVDDTSDDELRERLRVRALLRSGQLVP